MCIHYFSPQNKICAIISITMYEQIILMAVAFSSLAFGFMILRGSAKDQMVRISFFLMSLCLCAWSLSLGWFLIADTGWAIDVASRIFYISAAIFCLFMVLFNLRFYVINSVNKSEIIAVCSILAVATIVSLYISLTPEFIIDVSAIGTRIDLANVPINTDNYLIFSIFFILFFALSLYIAIRKWMVAKGRYRHQLMTFIAGMLIASVPGFVVDLWLPALGDYRFVWIGPLSIIIFLALMVYSTIRYGMFDLRVATVRAVGYTFTIAVIAAVYIVLAYAVSILFFRNAATQGVGMSPANIAIALMLALIFQPIKQFFDQFTNRIFYRGQYDQEVFFREFGKILSYDTDLRLLLRQASKYIADNLRAEKVFFNIADRGVFGVVKSKANSTTKIHQQDIEAIDEFYKNHFEFPAVMNYETIESQSIRDVLKLYQISLVLPLKLQDQTMGHLFIGEHKSRGYSMRDVRVIESVANELAIAVQNSLSVEEIRELNESLQTKVNTATKELRTSNQQLQKLDEAKNDFMSIASHQLRTPLTSIKGYLDMMLQGDLGKVTPTQRSVLSEAYVSSERMVSLINDFLSASRLQTGKFIIELSDGDLKDVVKDQVNILKVVAKQHNMTLELTIDKNVPNVKIDIDKIRQVIQNFIDNAIYYSMPNSKIKISLDFEGKQVVFRVKDTGIGVPADEQPQLFSRFFRAGNARRRRPDGTGIGLYLAKKVVSLHQGEIIFHSQENKGSTFGFRLPVR